MRPHERHSTLKFSSTDQRKARAKGVGKFPLVRHRLSRNGAVIIIPMDAQPERHPRELIFPCDSCIGRSNVRSQCVDEIGSRHDELSTQTHETLVPHIKSAEIVSRES